MAMAFLSRTLIPKQTLTSLSLSRSFKTASHISRSSPLLRLRPILALSDTRRFTRELSLRCFSTRPTTSSLNDPSPNWSNRPPKETILLDGCDFEHWLIVMEPPEGETTRDEIIDSYIKTLATVLGSEEEAKKSIYSVSTRHYFAFGCIVSEEISYKIKALPRVRWVLPDSYLDVKNKDYGGEPFIDGKAVPYDPKYHEEWVRNNARANERSRRNDRPRNFDRSRNFERRRENMQNRDFQNRDAPPMPNQDFQNRSVQNPMPARDAPPMPNQDFQNRNVQNPMPARDGPNMGFMPNRDAGGMPNRETGGMPNRDYQNRDMQNRDYQSNYMPNRDMGNMPSSNTYQGRDMPNREMGSMQNNDYQSNYMPNRDMGNMPSSNTYQGRDMPNREMGSMQNNDYQSNYMPNRNIGNMPSNNTDQGRDMPGRDLPPMPNRDY
eukprot:TRINITY_DN0_c0_g2_i2.p1 TRINITY_DN0_c0_g2~~TRINITY_DN0_c0_g2_i2.p1  ORF type:complete len:436 (+),score=57.39 TRINITY_DN0_c0_g2_i2:65-1372(+)